MSKTPNYDTAMQKVLDQIEPGVRVDRITGEDWELTEEEIKWYRKFNVPPATLSPVTRLKMLLGFATGISIWWNKDCKTNEPILSFMHPDIPIPCMNDKDWWVSDFSHDQAIDFDLPFFDQMRTLIQKTPYCASRDDGSNKNSVAVDMLNTEDSYMVFGGNQCRRLTYSALLFDTEDSIDTTNIWLSRNCYASNRIKRCFECKSCIECFDCMNSAFLFDCRNCENCFGGVNLRNRKFVFFGEQLKEEEYKKRVAEFDLSCSSVFEELRSRFHKMITEDAVWPEAFWSGAEDSQGEYLEKSVRVKHGYWLMRCADSFWCWVNDDLKNSAFCAWDGWGGNAYNCNGLVYVDNMKFCDQCWNSSSLEYCYNCHNCEFCFGCVGLQRKKYCVYNKQYTEEEYWQLVDELKCKMLDRGEYGEYFPADLSPMGMQFSIGAEFLGYSDQELERYGALKLDPKKGNVLAPHKVDATNAIAVDQIPDCLSDVDAKQLVGKPIYDAELGRPYSVLPREFEFYKKQGLPFPREHFLTRLRNLLRTSNTPLTELSKCHECSKEITVHKNQMFPKRKIYCRECYLKYLEANG